MDNNEDMSIEDKFTPYAIIPKPRLDLSMGGGGGSLGMGAGGRVGIDIPMDNANLNVGVSGQGYYMPKQGMGDFKATGIDASYSSGPNTFQAKFEQLSPEQKSLMLNYIKQF
jgi:hypothetical protein